MILLSRVLSVFDSRNDFINSSLGVCLSVLKSVSASLRVQSEGLMPSFLLPLVAQGPLLRLCREGAARTQQQKNIVCSAVADHWALSLVPRIATRRHV